MKPLTLDTAVREFKDYCQGNGDFDELDFKEYIIDVYCKQQVIKARVDELERIDGLAYGQDYYNYQQNRIAELAKELKEME